MVSMANKSANDLLVDTANMLNNRKVHPDLSSSLILNSITPDNAFPRNSNIPLLAEKDKMNLHLNVQKSSIQHDNDHINSCTAARTRSVQQWQKRKLFNLSKIEKPSPSMLCSCGDSWTPCVLCKRSSPNLPKLTQRQDMRDRVALVDLSYHPVLSFESGKSCKVSTLLGFAFRTCTQFHYDPFPIPRWHDTKIGKILRLKTAIKTKIRNGE
jgi:hypothetical protein